jgi:hypothetical protein
MQASLSVKQKLGASFLEGDSLDLGVELFGGLALLAGEGCAQG